MSEPAPGVGGRMHDMQQDLVPDIASLSKRTKKILSDPNLLPSSKTGVIEIERKDKTSSVSVVNKLQNNKTQHSTLCK